MMLLIVDLMSHTIHTTLSRKKKKNVLPRMFHKSPHPYRKTRNKVEQARIPIITILAMFRSTPHK